VKKILALGSDTMTNMVTDAMGPKGYEVICSTEIPNTLNIHNRGSYNLAIVDGGLNNIEDVCFKLIWDYRIRVVAYNKDKIEDCKALQTIGVEAFIACNPSEKPFTTEIEKAIGIGDLQFPKIKALVVEDDPSIREYIKTVLEILWPEAEITETDNGFKAAALAANDSLDIILLDLGLPDMSGLDLLKWLHGFCNTPVIIVTGHSQRETVIKAMTNKADDFIVKPFTKKDLVLRIKKVLDKVKNGERFNIQISV